MWFYFLLFTVYSTCTVSGTCTSSVTSVVLLYGTQSPGTNRNNKNGLYMCCTINYISLSLLVQGTHVMYVHVCHVSRLITHCLMHVSMSRSGARNCDWAISLFLHIFTLVIGGRYGLNHPVCFPHAHSSCTCTVNK